MLKVDKFQNREFEASPESALMDNYPAFVILIKQDKIE
jgi:hypothetical protein